MMNWAGNVAFSAATVALPTSIAELQDVVAAAGRAGRRVGVVGRRHSFSTIADTDGVLIDTSSLTAIDLGGAVWIEAGVRYSDLCPVLSADGRALRNLPSLPHVTVAGAVATGTHGSGDRNRGLADSVDAVELVTADGGLRTLERRDPEFRGVVVSLGALGVVARLRLRTEPSFDVAQTVYGELPMRVAIPHLDEIMATAYSVSLFTDWHSGRVGQIWVKRRTDRDPVPPVELLGARRRDAPCHPLPRVDPTACTEQLGRPGPWHERLTHFRADAVPSAGDELQSEFFVDRVDGRAAMEAVAAVSDRFAHLLLVSEIRSIAADDQWMSPSSGAAKLGLHFTWRRDQQAVEAALPTLEAALEPFAVRPHWGKVTTIDLVSVRERYPDFRRFRALADQLDPTHVFRNPSLDTLLA